MGGSGSVGKKFLAGYTLGGSTLLDKKKKKKDSRPASERRMVKARKDTPLLQQTALTPAQQPEQPNTGAGTALL